MSKQEGSSHLFLIVLISILVLTAGIAVERAKTSSVSQNKPAVKGMLLAKGGDDGGSDDSGGSNSGSGSSGGGESSSGSNSGSGSSGSSDSGSGSNENTSTPEPVRTEIRFSETERIRTETKDEGTRVDVTSGGVKVRYEIQNGRVIVKAENEDGEEVPENEIADVVERVGQNDIKVATAQGEILVSRNNVGALSTFPVQVDLNTNELIITTPAGTKTVAVLPDQAIQNLLAANVISRVNPALLTSSGITSVSDVITLGERNGVPIYEINGLNDHRLLGFIPVSLPTTVTVSAETGEVLSQQQSPVAGIVDFLSP